MTRTFSVEDTFVSARALGCGTAEAAAIAMMKVEGTGFIINQRSPEKLRNAVQKRSLRWVDLMPDMPGLARTEASARKWFATALGRHPLAEIELASDYAR